MDEGEEYSDNEDEQVQSDSDDDDMPLITLVEKSYAIEYVGKDVAV